MTVSQITPRHRELAHREDDGIEVSLLWEPATNDLRVCVHDRREGSCFEIRPQPSLALDVYYHPYVYRGFGTVACQAA
jgi:hypothetical protein